MLKIGVRMGKLSCKFNLGMFRCEHSSQRSAKAFHFICFKISSFECFKK